jgi:hypothetical protein
MRDSSSRSSGKRSKSLMYEDGTLLLFSEELESCALSGGLSEFLDGHDGNAQDMLLLQDVLMVQFMESDELVLETDDAAELGELGEVPGQPMDMGDDGIFGDACGNNMVTVMW